MSAFSGVEPFPSLRGTWVTLEPLSDSGDGYLSFRLHYLLPLTIEAQYFPAGA